ncbi:MAG: ComF family protein [Desulfobacteraceae bacterium]|nr:MAG: ComF family protein [Desulfobacteraceae bacterium]
MVNINPIKLTGNWVEGYALDIHTISSEFLGHDEFGHEVFDTKRSEMGELLYRLKYQSDKSPLKEILSVIEKFVNTEWKIAKILDGIVPVPPSRGRVFQPVLEVAKGISVLLHIPLYEGYLVKVKETPELKNVFDYQKRMESLNNAFIAENPSLKGKNVLVFDDLYRSGATCNAITRVLYQSGNVSKVYVLALTKTRSMS